LTSWLEKNDENLDRCSAHQRRPETSTASLYKVQNFIPMSAMRTRSVVTDNRVELSCRLAVPVIGSAPLCA